MGVTLERVQNKFACIIGELCNEPDVLSQFAIWVDLRIAEYKSKGAISLDCSGENPNPTWLRGFRPPAKEAFPHSRQSHFSQRDASLSPGQQRLWDQRSSHKVRSSDNGSSDVFHRGEVSRKRLSSDFNSPYLSNSDHNISPSKSQRLNSSQLTDFSQSIIEPTNESLMSIIGANQEPEVIEKTTTRENVDSTEITIVLDEEPDHDTLQSTSTSGDITHTQDRGGHSSQTSDISSEASFPTSGPYLTRGFVAVGTSAYPERLSYKSIRARISTDNKSNQIVKNLINAVGNLERWLWTYYRETRNIETIPYNELDAYLVEFFTVVRKQSGGDYTSVSLASLRCVLERYLKEHGYAKSISRSVEFFKSQVAFSRRRKSLTEIKHEPEVARHYQYMYQKTLNQLQGNQIQPQETLNQLHENPIQLQGNHIQPHETLNQLHENPIQLQKNECQFQENPNQLNENLIQLQENECQFKENPSQLRENPNQLQENPIQLQENKDQFQQNQNQLEDNRILLDD